MPAKRAIAILIVRSVFRVEAGKGAVAGAPRGPPRLIRGAMIGGARREGDSIRPASRLDPGTLQRSPT